MHQYKVHLPTHSSWDTEDLDNWFHQSYLEGVNKGLNKGDGDNFKGDFVMPTSLDQIPIDIGGSFTEDRI